MEDGKIVEVEAKEYMADLRKEAQALKDALRREKGSGIPPTNTNTKDSDDPFASLGASTAEASLEEFGGSIAGYIASRQGDVKALTEGISPEIVETMKKLVDFVLEGGTTTSSSSSANGGASSGQPLSDAEKAEIEMEIPASALQQLALWQLVLGYRLREAEVKGDYLRLLE